MGLLERVEVLAAVTAGAFERAGFIGGWVVLGAGVVGGGDATGDAGCGSSVGVGSVLAGARRVVGGGGVGCGAGGVGSVVGGLGAGSGPGCSRDEAMLVELAGRLSVDELAVVLRRWEVLADDVG
ncbi:MAG: hypothetical protein R2690_08010 [Acidimicrobiales bacterium]